MKVAVCDDQEIFLKAVYNEVKSLSYLEISLFDDSTKLAEEIKNGEYYDLFIPVPVCLMILLHLMCVIHWC